MRPLRQLSAAAPGRNAVAFTAAPTTPPPPPPPRSGTHQRAGRPSPSSVEGMQSWAAAPLPPPSSSRALHTMLMQMAHHAALTPTRGRGSRHPQREEQQPSSSSSSSLPPDGLLQRLLLHQRRRGHRAVRETERRVKSLAAGVPADGVAAQKEEAVACSDKPLPPSHHALEVFTAGVRDWGVTPTAQHLNLLLQLAIAEGDAAQAERIQSLHLGLLLALQEQQEKQARLRDELAVGWGSSKCAEEEEEEVMSLPGYVEADAATAAQDSVRDQDSSPAAVCRSLEALEEVLAPNATTFDLMMEAQFLRLGRSRAAAWAVLDLLEQRQAQAVQLTAAGLHYALAALLLLMEHAAPPSSRPPEATRRSAHNTQENTDVGVDVDGVFSPSRLTIGAARAAYRGASSSIAARALRQAAMEEGALRPSTPAAIALERSVQEDGGVGEAAGAGPKYWAQRMQALSPAHRAIAAASSGGNTRMAGQGGQDETHARSWDRQRVWELGHALYVSFISSSSRSGGGGVDTARGSSSAGAGPGAALHHSPPSGTGNSPTPTTMRSAMHPFDYYYQQEGASASSPSPSSWPGCGCSAIQPSPTEVVLLRQMLQLLSQAGQHALVIATYQQYEQHEALRATAAGSRGKGWWFWRHRQHPPGADARHRCEAEALLCWEQLAVFPFPSPAPPSPSDPLSPGIRLSSPSLPSQQPEQHLGWAIWRLVSESASVCGDWKVAQGVWEAAYTTAITAAAARIAYLQDHRLLVGVGVSAGGGLVHPLLSAAQSSSAAAAAAAAADDDDGPLFHAAAVPEWMRGGLAALLEAVLRSLRRVRRYRNMLQLLDSLLLDALPLAALTPNTYAAASSSLHQHLGVQLGWLWRRATLLLLAQAAAATQHLPLLLSLCGTTAAAAREGEAAADLVGSGVSITRGGVPRLVVPCSIPRRYLPDAPLAALAGMLHAGAATRSGLYSFDVANLALRTVQAMLRQHLLRKEAGEDQLALYTHLDRCSSLLAYRLVQVLEAQQQGKQKEEEEEEEEVRSSPRRAAAIRLWGEIYRLTRAAEAGAQSGTAAALLEVLRPLVDSHTTPVSPSSKAGTVVRSAAAAQGDAIHVLIVVDALERCRRWACREASASSSSPAPAQAVAEDGGDGDTAPAWERVNDRVLVGLQQLFLLPLDQGQGHATEAPRPAFTLDDTAITSSAVVMACRAILLLPLHTTPQPQQQQQQQQRSISSSASAGPVAHPFLAAALLKEAVRRHWVGPQRRAALLADVRSANTAQLQQVTGEGSVATEGRPPRKTAGVGAARATLLALAAHEVPGSTSLVVMEGGKPLKISSLPLARRLLSAAVDVLQHQSDAHRLPSLCQVLQQAMEDAATPFSPIRVEEEVTAAIAAAVPMRGTKEEEEDGEAQSLALLRRVVLHALLEGLPLFRSTSSSRLIEKRPHKDKREVSGSVREAEQAYVQLCVALLQRYRLSFEFDSAEKKSRGSAAATEDTIQLLRHVVRSAAATSATSPSPIEMLVDGLLESNWLPPPTPVHSTAQHQHPSASVSALQEEGYLLYVDVIVWCCRHRRKAPVRRAVPWLRAVVAAAEGTSAGKSAESAVSAAVIAAQTLSSGPHTEVVAQDWAVLIEDLLGGILLPLTVPQQQEQEKRKGKSAAAAAVRLSVSALSTLLDNCVAVLQKLQLTLHSLLVGVSLDAHRRGTTPLGGPPAAPTTLFVKKGDGPERAAQQCSVTAPTAAVPKWKAKATRTIPMDVAERLDDAVQAYLALSERYTAIVLQHLEGSITTAPSSSSSSSRAAVSPVLLRGLAERLLANQWDVWYAAFVKERVFVSSTQQQQQQQRVASAAVRHRLRRLLLWEFQLQDHLAAVDPQATIPGGDASRRLVLRLQQWCVMASDLAIATTPSRQPRAAGALLARDIASLTGEAVDRPPSRTGTPIDQYLEAVEDLYAALLASDSTATVTAGEAEAKEAHVNNKSAGAVVLTPLPPLPYTHRHPLQCFSGAPWMLLEQLLHSSGTHRQPPWSRSSPRAGAEAKDVAPGGQLAALQAAAVRLMVLSLTEEDEEGVVMRRSVSKGGAQQQQQQQRRRRELVVRALAWPAPPCLAVSYRGGASVSYEQAAQASFASVALRTLLMMPPALTPAAGRHAHQQQKEKEVVQSIAAAVRTILHGVLAEHRALLHLYERMAQQLLPLTPSLDPYRAQRPGNYLHGFGATGSVVQLVQLLLFQAPQRQRYENPSDVISGPFSSVRVRGRAAAERRTGASLLPPSLAAALVQQSDEWVAHLLWCSVAPALQLLQPVQPSAPHTTTNSNNRRDEDNDLWAAEELRCFVWRLAVAFPAVMGRSLRSAVFRYKPPLLQPHQPHHQIPGPRPLFHPSQLRGLTAFFVDVLRRAAAAESASASGAPTWSDGGTREQRSCASPPPAATLVRSAVAWCLLLRGALPPQPLDLYAEEPVLSPQRWEPVDRLHTLLQYRHTQLLYCSSSSNNNNNNNSNNSNNSSSSRCNLHQKVSCMSAPGAETTQQEDEKTAQEGECKAWDAALFPPNDEAIQDSMRADEEAFVALMTATAPPPPPRGAGTRGKHHHIYHLLLQPHVREGMKAAEKGQECGRPGPSSRPAAGQAQRQHAAAIRSLPRPLAKEILYAVLRHPSEEEEECVNGVPSRPALLFFPSEVLDPLLLAAGVEARRRSDRSSGSSTTTTTTTAMHKKEEEDMRNRNAARFETALAYLLGPEEQRGSLPSASLRSAAATPSSRASSSTSSLLRHLAALSLRPASVSMEKTAAGVPLDKKKGGATTEKADADAAAGSGAVPIRSGLHPVLSFFSREESHRRCPSCLLLRRPAPTPPRSWGEAFLAVQQHLVPLLCGAPPPPPPQPQQPHREPGGGPITPFTEAVIQDLLMLALEADCRSPSPPIDVGLTEPLARLLPWLEQQYSLYPSSQASSPSPALDSRAGAACVGPWQHFLRRFVCGVLVPLRLTEWECWAGGDLGRNKPRRRLNGMAAAVQEEKDVEEVADASLPPLHSLLLLLRSLSLHAVTLEAVALAGRAPLPSTTTTVSRLRGEGLQVLLDSLSKARHDATATVLTWMPPHHNEPASTSGRFGTSIEEMVWGLRRVWLQCTVLLSMPREARRIIEAVMAKQINDQEELCAGTREKHLSEGAVWRAAGAVADALAPGQASTAAPLVARLWATRPTTAMVRQLLPAHLLLEPPPSASSQDLDAAESSEIPRARSRVWWGWMRPEDYHRYLAAVQALGEVPHSPGPPTAAAQRPLVPGHKQRNPCGAPITPGAEREEVKRTSLPAPLAAATHQLLACTDPAEWRALRRAIRNQRRSTTKARETSSTLYEAWRYVQTQLHLLPPAELTALLLGLSSPLCSEEPNGMAASRTTTADSKRGNDHDRHHPPQERVEAQLRETEMNAKQVVAVGPVSYPFPHSTMYVPLLWSTAAIQGCRHWTDAVHLLHTSLSTLQPGPGHHRPATPVQHAMMQKLLERLREGWATSTATNTTGGATELFFSKGISAFQYPSPVAVVPRGAAARPVELEADVVGDEHDDRGGYRGAPALVLYLYAACCVGPAAAAVQRSTELAELLREPLLGGGKGDSACKMSHPSGRSPVGVATLPVPSLPQRLVVELLRTSTQAPALTEGLFQVFLQQSYRRVEGVHPFLSLLRAARQCGREDEGGKKRGHRPRNQHHHHHHGAPPLPARAAAMVDRIDALALALISMDAYFHTAVIRGNPNNKGGGESGTLEANATFLGGLLDRLEAAFAELQQQQQQQVMEKKSKGPISPLLVQHLRHRGAAAAAAPPPFPHARTERCGKRFWTQLGISSDRHRSEGCRSAVQQKPQWQRRRRPGLHQILMASRVKRRNEREVRRVQTAEGASRHSRAAESMLKKDEEDIEQAVISFCRSALVETVRVFSSLSFSFDMRRTLNDATVSAPALDAAGRDTPAGAGLLSEVEELMALVTLSPRPDTNPPRRWVLSSSSFFFSSLFSLSLSLYNKTVKKDEEDNHIVRALMHSQRKCMEYSNYVGMKRIRSTWLIHGTLVALHIDDYNPYISCVGKAASALSSSTGVVFSRTLRRLARTNRYTDGSGRALESNELPRDLYLPNMSNRAYPRQGHHWQPTTRVAVPATERNARGAQPNIDANEDELAQQQLLQAYVASPAALKRQQQHELQPSPSAVAAAVQDQQMVVREVPSPHKGRVIIAGGGIVGLTTAALWGLRGWHTTVLEASPPLAAVEEGTACRSLTDPSGKLRRPHFTDTTPAGSPPSAFPPFIELQYALVNRRAADVFSAAGIPTAALRRCGVPVVGILDHPGGYHNWLSRGLTELHPFATKVLAVDVWALRRLLEEHVAGELPHDNVCIFWNHRIKAVYPLRNELVISEVVQPPTPRAEEAAHGEEEMAVTAAAPTSTVALAPRLPTSLTLSPMKWERRYAKDAVSYDLLLGADGVNSQLRDLLDVEGFAADENYGIRWFLLRSRRRIKKGNVATDTAGITEEQQREQMEEEGRQKALAGLRHRLDTQEDRFASWGAVAQAPSPQQQQQQQGATGLLASLLGTSPSSAAREEEEEAGDAYLSPRHIHRWLHRHPKKKEKAKAAGVGKISSAHPTSLSIAFPRLENNQVSWQSGRTPRNGGSSAASPSEEKDPYHYFSVMAYMPRDILDSLSDEAYFRTYLPDVWKAEAEAEAEAGEAQQLPSPQAVESSLKKDTTTTTRTTTSPPLVSFSSVSTPAPTIFCEHLYNTVGLPNAVVLGDAAHYANPFWLQQLPMALEDGLHLLQHVDAYSRHVYDALKQFSDERGVSGDALRELTDRCLYYQREKHRNPLLRLRNWYQRWLNRVTPTRVNTLYEGSANHIYSRSIEEMLNGRGYTSYEFAEKQQSKHRMSYHFGRLFT
eukprot:gene1359-794_t